MSEPRPRITHELKTWPEFFNQTWQGRKKFELRRNDRDFQVGDQLLLKEWLPEAMELGPGVRVLEGYTGRENLVRVDYIMEPEMVHELMGLRSMVDDFVIMSISHWSTISSS